MINNKEIGTKPRCENFKSIYENNLEGIKAEKVLFTSESVTEGHPDKVCDQISDAILDELLKNDTDSRVACETLITKGLVFVCGEITSKYNLDLQSIVRNTIDEIGYNDPKYGFDSKTCSIISSINNQSPDIAIGVDIIADNKKSFGAGDQGMVFGYADNETKELMPMSIILAHKLAHRLAEVRKNNVLDFLGPDGKTQVTLEYLNGIPINVDTIIVSSQHSEEVSLSKVRDSIIECVIKPIIPSHLFNNETKILINPTGRFVIGGPNADTGLTGRKIIVDTYGSCSRHGGGAFSGKDPTKVDRSAAYQARYIAKNIVASGLSKKCEIQIGYAIGNENPVSVYINTFNTGIISDENIKGIILENFNLKPYDIIKGLNLFNPIYKQTASYGHFGRTDIDLTWERTDKAEMLRSRYIL